MKELLIKGLKIFFICALVVFLILLVFGGVLLLDWPWWVGIFVLVGLIGLGIGLLFVRKIWLRRREQRFVHQIIEQDEAYIKGRETREQEPLKELQQRWKEATDMLRRSHMKIHGNPLYLLPWYLIIGESGSGKTTAITSARLSSPFAEVNRTSGISGTRNCDWWFFEQAIILDTAGRYAIPIDESRDKEEWQKFLSLLLKYRKKEPLNGLIVSVAADKLLQADREKLEEDGRDIRRRIDELMRALGAKFPVHVLVTKCDLVQGMTQFCDHLAEKRLEQAMGCMNQELSKDALSFPEQTCDTISDHLRDLRLLIFHQSHTESFDPSFLIFPEEFEKLKPGLGAFIRGAFQENPYQETPILRGVFFSSGRQEGTPYSHFLRALGLIEERDVLPGTNRGFFLHDFFAKILPRDRHLFAPTQRALEWQRVSRNLGLTSWIALGVALCGLLSFSFVKNLKILREASHELLRPPTITGQFPTDLQTLEGLHETISYVEKANRGWWTPRFGLTESEKVETELKNRFRELFRQGFLASFDQEMGARIAEFSGTTSDETIGEYVNHVTRRVDLLKARLDGKDLEDLREMPQPSYELMLGQVDREVLDEIKDEFGNLYLTYLIWRPTSAELHEEMNALQTWLEGILTLKDKDLKWLVAWVNQQDSLQDVTLESFWEGSSPLTEKILIQRSFTRAGKEKLDVFLKEIEGVLQDPAVIANRKEEFARWYEQAYLGAWYDFATNFPQGKEMLQTREEWQRIAAQMASDEGPFAAVLDTMALELEPVAEAQKLPAWVNQLYRFQVTKATATEDQLSHEKGVLEKATQKAKALTARLKTSLSKATGESWKLQKKAVEGYVEYRKALAQITPAAASERFSRDLAAQTFEEDPVTSQAPFFMAQNGLNTWRQAVSAGQKTDQTVWRLVKGPFDHLWSFVVNETGCTLQTDWEKKVLSKIEGVSARSAEKMVLGEGGLTWTFVDGPAGPFLERVLKKGFVAREVLGTKISFSPEFLNFLSQKGRSGGSAPSQYEVTIRGRPTGSKPDAAIKPHETRLTLQCGSGIQTMINVGIPVSQVFSWSAETCRDVILEIDVGGLTLTKRYTGDQAFREFLLDFQKGYRVFRPRDFPSEKAALQAAGISSITVRYRFKGHGQVINMPRPVKIPREIVACWHQ